METAFTGARLNVMTHALYADEGPLPQGLMIQNAYTEMHNSSKDVAIVARNSTVYPQTLKKKVPMAKMVTANWVPESQMQPGMIDVLDVSQGIQPQKMTMGQSQEKLFKKLELGSLESWSLTLAETTHLLLVEYHIFSPASLAVLIQLNM